MANPRLICCHVKGFSDDGPYGCKPAYDDIIQALSGLAMLQTVVGCEPRYVPSIIADKITGVHAAYAVVLALLHRERTGQAQAVSVPMLETLVAFTAQEHLGGAVFEPRIGNMGYDPMRQAMRRPYATRDGFLCLVPHRWPLAAVLRGDRPARPRRRPRLRHQQGAAGRVAAGGRDLGPSGIDVSSRCAICDMSPIGSSDFGAWKSA